MDYLKKFNHCHDGQIESIVFDIDIGNWDKEQNLIITYSMAIEEKNENNEYIITGYNHYNMIFKNPSYFAINMKTGSQELTKEELCNVHKRSYGIDSRYIYEVKEIKKSINHCNWKIKMCDYDGYINIYADDLKIEKVKIEKDN